MQPDLFCEDYYVPPKPQLIELIKNLAAWERKNLTLYPKDVMNMLVDAEVLTVHDIKVVAQSVQDKPLDVVLPTNHIS
jgi:hypothetical protein